MTNKLIIDTLEPLDIPVCFQTYKGTKQPDGSIKIVYPYITFFEYITQGEAFSDDDEEETGHYIQVDVWSDASYTELVMRVNKLFKNAGFKRSKQADLYEYDTKIFHKGLRYFYLEDLTL